MREIRIDLETYEALAAIFVRVYVEKTGQYTTDELDVRLRARPDGHIIATVERDGVVQATVPVQVCTGKGRAPLPHPKEYMLSLGGDCYAIARWEEGAWRLFFDCGQGELRAQGGYDSWEAALDAM